jgi:hypothetical protein
MLYNVVMNKEKKDSKKDTKKKQQIEKQKKEKQKYFDFYDDVKHYSNGKEDW